MRDLRRILTNRKHGMNNSTTTQDIIDLTDSGDFSATDLKERHQELDRVARKIDALKGRQATLRRELGLAGESGSSMSENIDSVVFLDETADVFAAAPSEAREGTAVDFDIDDVDFDERFAAFAVTDEEGDHKARRWFHRS